MPSDSYSFLDVAVLDEIRQRFAAGDALAIVSANLEQVLWANGPGATLFGYDDIEAIIGTSARLPLIARRQVMATSGFPDIGTNRALLIRLATGMSSNAVAFHASAITMPDGEKAILLAVPAAPPDPLKFGELLARAIGGFTEEGHFLAFIDGNGAVEAASDGFDGLAISQQTLAALVAEVANERDRIVKRLVPAGARSYPAGLARLTDEPARHLLVVIDEGQFSNFAPDVSATRETSPVSGSPIVGPAAAPEYNEPLSRAAAMPERSETGQSSIYEAPRSQRPWYVEAAMDEDARKTLSTERDPEEEPDNASGAQSSEAQSAGATGDEVAGSTQSETDPVSKRNLSPVRFVWRIDSQGQFSAMSPEFGAAVGQPAADVVGRRFRDVATTFGLDPAGEIEGLLERRDTWSGRSVLWPIAGTELKVPVDLAALPVYSRDREFEGFRGFGVARMADAVADPEKIGMALVPNGHAPAAHVETVEEPAGDDVPDPFQGEVPALTIMAQPERRFTDKVIRLAEHRPATSDKGLSTLERSAFREIGERLKKENTPAAEPPSGDNSAEFSDIGDDEGAGDPVQLKSEPLPAPDSEAVADHDEVHGDGNIAETDEDKRTDSPDLAEGAPALPEDEEAAERAIAAPSVQTPRPPLQTSDFLPSAFALGNVIGAPDTSILSKLPVPLLIHSGDILHYANDEFLDLAGYETLDELEEAGGLDALFADPYDDDSSDEADRSLHLKTRDGLEFPIEALLRSVPWQSGKALMLVIRRTGEELPDDAQAAESPDQASVPSQPEISELKSRIAEMRTIIDTATDGVVLIARDGTIRSISRPAEALFSFESDEVAGKPFASLFAIESQRAAHDYLNGLSEHGVASVLNDGREVIGREAQGRFIPLFMTIGRLPNESGFCAVVRDITQWKRAEEDLTQARTVAERASSQKTDFLARISHEIRTPLNAIIGFSELMVDEKFGPVANDRYRDYLRDINRSGNHVLDLVNDLLDISKIEAGQQEMDYEAVSLNDTLAETVALMQPQANRERVIIRSSFASRLPEVVADLRSVRQIALNILSNAIRYTQAGGQVIVSTAYEPAGDVVLRVRDTGIGMSQAEIEQALKPFKQINALKRGRGDGTGLGLPLTKAMVEANRARFTINSTPGEGTMVEVAFPSTRVLAE